jgi:hypothetical protein
MTGSTLTTLAANPAPDPETGLICTRLSICSLDVEAFVPLRFAIIFYSKIIIIESSPQQSEGHQFSY